MKVFLFRAWLGLGAILLAKPVFAESFASDLDCAPVDYRASLGPARDQGEASWCFAFSAADLVSQRVGFAVSAMDVATTFLLGDAGELARMPRSDLQNYLRSHPGFARRLFKFRMADPTSNSPRNILTKDGLFDVGGDEAAAILMLNLKGLCHEDSLPSNMTLRLESDLAELQKAWAAQLKSDGSEPVSMARIGAILDPAARARAVVFQNYVDRQCRRVQGPVLIPREVHAADTLIELDRRIRAGQTTLPKVHRVIMNEVDDRLSHGRIVAVGYNSYDIEEGPDEGDGDHSSLLVARRPFGSECRYFLRNSMGARCDYLRPELRPFCEPQFGGVWVTHAHLRTLYSAVSL